MFLAIQRFIGKRAGPTTHSVPETNSSKPEFVIGTKWNKLASGQGGQWIVSTQAATAPLWSRNGQDLLYATADGPVMAVHYLAKGDTFVADKPRVWMTKYTGGAHDVSSDGKRLAAIVPEHAAAVPQVEHEVVFLQNFFDELRRKVPAGK